MPYNDLTDNEQFIESSNYLHSIISNTVIRLWEMYSFVLSLKYWIISDTPHVMFEILNIGRLPAIYYNM